MSNKSNFWTGLLAGAAVGAVVAILFAPAKGDETRATIKRKLDEMNEELKRMKNKFKSDLTSDDVNEKMSQMEAKINDLMDQLKKEI